MIKIERNLIDIQLNCNLEIIIFQLSFRGCEL